MVDAFELWCWRKLLRVPWTARRSNQSILKGSVLGVHWKDRCWSWNSSTLATWCGELTRLKRPWCWERLRADGEGDDRGWDGWMASLTQWTWVWVNSGWWTGRPGMLRFMESQRVGHNWATELNWSFLSLCWLYPPALSPDGSDAVELNSPSYRDEIKNPSISEWRGLLLEPLWTELTSQISGCMANAHRIASPSKVSLPLTTTTTHQRLCSNAIPGRTAALVKLPTLGWSKNRGPSVQFKEALVQF